MIPLVLPTILPIDQAFHDAVDFRSLRSSDHTPGIGTGLTIVVRLRPKAQLLGGPRIRLQFRGPSNLKTAGTVITGAYIGYAAASSTRDAWDWNSGGGTQLTFNGQTGVTLEPRSSVLTDIATFEFVPSAIHLVAYQITSGSLRRLTDIDGSQRVVSYYKENTLEAGTTNKGADYTAFADTSFALSRIRVAKGRDELDG